MSLKYSKEKKKLKKALKLDPTNFELLIELGFFYYEFQRYRKAIKIYNKALKLNSNDSELWYLLGCLYEDKGEYRNALDKYMNAHRINKEDPVILNAVANIYIKLNAIEWATSTYKIILFFYPGLNGSLEALSDLLSERGKYKEAIKFCKRAVEYNNMNPFNWLQLGKVYHSEGDYEKAIISYKKALEIYPENVEVLNHLRKAYVEIGRNDLALSTLFSEFLIHKKRQQL